MEERVDETIRGWIQYVEMHGVSFPGAPPKEFEIGRSIQYLVTDLIVYLGFGYPFGFVQKHGDVYGILETVTERLPIVEQMTIFTEFSDILNFLTRIPWLKRRLVPSAGDKNGIGKMLTVSLYCERDIVRAFC